MAYDYPTQMSIFRKRRNESVHLYPAMSSLPQHWSALKHSKSMLSLGPGPGEYEIEFMVRCLPSLEFYTGVECDEYCSGELEKNLKSRMADKIKWKIVKTSMVGWESDRKFDVIMLSHCMYSLNTEERKDVLRKCLNEYLTTNGVVVMVDRLNNDGKVKNVVFALQNFFKDSIVYEKDVDDVLEEMIEVGGEVVNQQQLNCQCDFREFGEDITFIINLFSSAAISSESCKEAVQKLNLENGIGQYFVKVALIRKK